MRVFLQRGRVAPGDPLLRTESCSFYYQPSLQSKDVPVTFSAWVRSGLLTRNMHVLVNATLALISFEIAFWSYPSPSYGKPEPEHSKQNILIRLFPTDYSEKDLYQRHSSNRPMKIMRPE